MVSIRKIWVFWRIAIGALALMGLTLGPPPPVQAAASSSIPFNAVRYADCTQEMVTLSGNIHLLIHPQSNGNILVHFNYQGATGIGQTSGITYRASAVDQLLLGYSLNLNVTRNFQLISQGVSSNLLITVVYRVTTSSTGEVTVHVDTLNMRCTE